METNLKSRAVVAQAALLALAACTPASTSSTTADETASPPLTEVDTAALTLQGIDGAPHTHRLRATRLDDAGHRRIEHFDGATWATFLEDDLIPLNMEGAYGGHWYGGAGYGGHGYGQHWSGGTYVGDKTIVCAQAIDQTATLDGLRVICAVREGGEAFGARGTVVGEPSAWLHDVCIGEAGAEFLLLVSSADSLVPADPLAPPPAGGACGTLAWNGSAWLPGAASACSCAQLDGKPCSDPCFVGTGTWQGGQCIVAGLPPACDDGDPSTIDSCSGDPDELCTHDAPDLDDPALE